MSHCVRCGGELPAFSFGKASDTCRACRDATERPSTSAERLFSRASLRRSTPATSAILGINALILLGMVIATGGKALVEPTTEILLRWGGDYGPLTLTRQPWRAFTATWIHAGIIHLFLNLWCLDLYGRLAEILFGRRFYLALYMFAGLCGSIASLAWNPTVVGVGASAAIFGVVGALAVPYMKGKLPIPPVKAANSRLIAFVGLNLIIGMAIPGIGNAAHLGGLAGGLALGAMWTKCAPENEKRIARGIAAAGLIAILAFLAVRVFRGPATLAHQAAQAFSEGRTDEAVAKAMAAVARDDRNSIAHAVLGSAYMQLSQAMRAVQELEKAIQINPNYGYALARLGQAYISLERFPDAVRVLERAVKLNPDETLAWTDLGLAYAGVDRTDDAIKAIQTAVRKEPDLAYAHDALGRVRQRRNEFDLAIGSFRQAVRLQPEEKYYAAHLADALDANGFHEEAESIRRKARLQE